VSSATSPYPTSPGAKAIVVSRSEATATSDPEARKTRAIGPAIATSAAAASAVAAKYLAQPDARSAAFIGCGVQGRAHVAAISRVRRLDRVVLFDSDVKNAMTCANELQKSHSFEISVARDVRSATRASSIIVTSTPSTRAFMSREDVAPGAFIAAVGADSEQKHEISADLLKSAVIVVDDLDQCASIGDLHHAIDAGLLSRTDVAATLAEVVAGTNPGRTKAEDIVVFDSTGVAIEDVAAAAIVFERAERDPGHLGSGFSFASA
jgi:ornithine cyclodeaminase/alanine dehydrogenase-like protein (mu-crystallin family)